MLWVIKFAATALYQQDFVALTKAILLASQIAFTAVFPPVPTVLERFGTLSSQVADGSYCQVHVTDEMCAYEAYVQAKYKADRI